MGNSTSRTHPELTLLSKQVDVTRCSNRLINVVIFEILDGSAKERTNYVCCPSSGSDDPYYQKDENYRMYRNPYQNIMIYLEYNHPRYAEFYHKIQQNHVYKFETTSKGRIVNVYETDTYQVIGKISHFLPIKDNKHYLTLLPNQRDDYVEILFEEGIVRNEYYCMRIILPKNKLGGLKLYQSYKFIIQLFADGNKYLVNEITVNKD